eukprot:m.19547 g.19547  ORF g.19547 m.19547 type:complete len:121 (+) comp27852_c0_seq1:67-429(+)
MRSEMPLLPALYCPMAKFPHVHDVFSEKAPFYLQLKLAVVESGSTKWEEIALFLGFDENSTSQIKERSQDNKVRLGYALEEWATSAEDPKVKRLLKACEEAGVNERVVKANYNSLKDFHK